MALTMTEINDIHARLHRAAPHLRGEIDRLVREAVGTRRVQWVEVTHADGCVEVMAADEYQRLTATDLAHRGLRILSAAEAEKLGRKDTHS